MKIEELLASRTDLSTFLVHLTRSASGRSAKDNLKKIISEQKLLAGAPFGIAAKQLDDKGLSVESQRVICFTETPMEHLSLLSSEIENRTYKFEPYGLAFTRKQCRSLGVNPVWYIDITPGHTWLMNPLNKLVEDAISTGSFDSKEISKITPFIEQMGIWGGDPEKGNTGYRKEFWWEREWRYVGDFDLPNTYMILCPNSDIKELKELIDGLDGDKRPRVSFIDPSWSLERIIGKLAGFSSADLGPF